VSTDGHTHARTHARTDAKQFYYLSHAICYSYGADKYYHHHHHRLCGSASPVLTATGFVNGKWQFSTPQYRHHSTDHQKICHRWLPRRPLRLYQIRCIHVHGGFLRAWVKYNQNCFYLCSLLGTHLHVRHVDGFSRMMTQTTRSRARMCLLWDLFTWLPILGGQNCPKPPILSVNTSFQAKLAKSKNVHMVYSYGGSQTEVRLKNTWQYKWDYTNG